MNHPSYQAPTRQEIQMLIDGANQLRAETVKQMVVGLGRGATSVARAIVGGAIALGEAFAEARRAQTLYEQLSRMNARELADIGITRGDIPAVVAGTFRREVDGVSKSAPGAEVTHLKPVRAPAPTSEIRKAA